VGQIFGIPGVRGNQILPHRLHLCSVITSMCLTLRMRKRKVVVRKQPASCPRATCEREDANGSKSPIKIGNLGLPLGGPIGSSALAG
jgi:hypothetical protein